MSERKRARDLGVRVGVLPPGPHNAITDVAGVLVGHQTVWRGEAVRTGVTTILPHGGNLFQEKVPAAVHVGNGFGKLAGALQVQELGELETAIALTNTLSVPAALNGLIQHTLSQPGNEQVYSVNALVGETNDGFLNDIRGQHVTEADVRAALAAAAGGTVAEGSVGAGTGTSCFGFKGGIGTASRRLPAGLPTNTPGYTVGVLVQSNYGGLLTINGQPVGQQLGHIPFKDALNQAETGSCMVVVATDAPLGSRNLNRLAQRAILGLGRTGSFLGNGSGDFVIAFTTAYRLPHGGPPALPASGLLRNEQMNPLFMAVVEATEEAIYNSLFMATTVVGMGGRRREAIGYELLAVSG